MSINLKFFLLLTIFLFTPVRALELYSGEVAVPDQSAVERQKSVPAALIQVLQKHSGQRELPLHPALDAALLSANRIMVSFYYRDHQRTAPDGTVSNEWRLVANFLPEAVDRILRDLELPRWAAERKPVTIWIVVDDGLGRRLMPVEYGYAWDALSDVANLRGLPIRWHGMEEEQLQLIDLQLLWGGFTDELVTGEDGDGVVIVAARREGPVWNVRWNFASGDETSGWRNRDTDLSFALVDGLHRLTDLVASRNAIAASAQGKWQSELSIGGFRNASDYARCLAYLEGLSVVDDVGISQVSGGSVRFVLELNALPEYLLNEISRGRMLSAGLADDEYYLVHASDFLPQGQLPE